jgi:hypothetical protein
MKFHKAQWLIGYTMLAILLSSCNLGATPAPTQDIGAIQTQAFGQVLTQVAAASSPTPLPTNTPAPTNTLAAPATFASIGGGTNGTVTPFAFNTPLAGLTPLALSPVPTLGGLVPTLTTENGCNNGVFISESQPYDGATMDAGKEYEKSFTYKNMGSCTWDEGYAFVFMPSFSTPGFKGYDILIKKGENYTKPMGTITFVLKLRTSPVPGEHIGAWKLRDDAGNFFGSMVHIKYSIGTNAERNAAATAAAKTAAAAGN